MLPHRFWLCDLRKLNNLLVVVGEKGLDKAPSTPQPKGKMKDTTELIIATLAMALILALADIAYMKRDADTIHMNGSTYLFVGLTDIVNPADGKHLYQPLYQKVK